ncbi:MAG TPA: calcineurin-like phosphoesterase C-terminal domain-containing protein [Sedimentisphaerales bacterium]|nr:calcineurin-like phosphoesterase C-terminal domain-containing protein [Sedimentisphaerales bacterium]
MKRNSLFSVATLVTMLTAGAAMADVTGTVYNDLNRNGKMDAGEPGIAGVCVSNSKEVVKTDAAGKYTLPAYDEMIVFVVKPAGWMTPVDANNIPRFSYVHKPNGSPASLQRFRGLEPTGPLPAAINFALYRVNEPETFTAVINGDSQVYNHREINYLRDSFVKDVKANQPDAAFCISMGDNIGDELALFPHYHAVMGEMGIPVHYVPGNHDMDFDVSSPADSFDTHKSYVGALYYSFNYGKVHFMVLNSVQAPVDPSRFDNTGNYTGAIDATQMEWIKNDLAMVPMDHLIVLNMHIPIVSDEDRIGAGGTKHQVANREALYDLVAGRKVFAMGGHTHTLSHFVPGDELEGWGRPTPIHQIIVGAACGSWWSGELDDSLVPYSYQRCGTPRNYLVFEFDGNNYRDTFKGSLMDANRQMHMSFLTESFIQWFEARSGNDPNTTIFALDNRNILSQSDLQLGSLVINFYNGSSNSLVTCQFDDGAVVEALKTLEVMDPFALANQMYVLRGVPGFNLWAAPSFGTGNGAVYGPGAPAINDAWMRSTGVVGQGVSTHLWVCDIPDNLEPGMHTVAVTAVDMYGQIFTDKLVFEVAP